MATELQFRRGTTATRILVLLGDGEAFFDTDSKSWYVGDGVQLGGFPVSNSLVTEISGTTQTIDDSDAGKFFVYTNAAGCAVALAEAGSVSGTYFPTKAGFWAINLAAGTVTITATTSTINGSPTLSLANGDSTVVVSDGTDYFSMVSRAAVTTIANVHVVGNTTAASSTTTLQLTNLMISGAGGLSAGFSGSTLVLSTPPTVNTSYAASATGNTTGATSSTTLALSARVLSGAGGVSVGYSGSTLIVSGGATTAGATALGNTTGATSSTTLALSAYAVSGAGGVSVGYSGSTLIVSGGAGGATTYNASALGNTTGATSSTTLGTTPFVISGSGGASVGFSGNTIIVAGATGGGGGSGLYAGLFSTLPTSAGTGLTTWLNQGGRSVADTTAGVAITSPSNGGSIELAGRYKTAPSTPYTITALVAGNSNASFPSAGIFFYDGTNKCQGIGPLGQSGPACEVLVINWTTPTSLSGVVNGNLSATGALVWLQLVDDGTNVFFKHSADGVNWVTQYSIAKASGFLGGSGYTNVGFFTTPQNSNDIKATLMSYAET